jgi:hypothetical protein|tara:strand:+ start:2557 stop:3615 length:1059 start_codon:yes stop_codon:yes gene_type:complete
MMVGSKTISCIVLNCLNDLFVKERLIPSIKRTTEHLTDWDIEIIVVDNGPDQNFKMKGIKVIKSLPYHVPKAYNLAIKNTNKHYIALFHDDVDILDYNWVLKTTSNLSEEIYAVGPDLCTTFPHKKFKIKSFLKEAPMIMEREKFWEIGGYDEEYYFGYEDLKLSNAIYNLGKKIKKVRINSLHFGGTSTVLITHNNETQTKLKKEILKFYTVKEHNNFLLKHPDIEVVKTNILKRFKSPLMWILMLIFNKSIYIKNLKKISDNLGIRHVHDHWKIERVPAELSELLLPNSAKEMDLYLRDIKENKNGELYGKLEKWKNKKFEEYVDSDKSKLDEVNFKNVFTKIKKSIWEN